MQSSIALTAIAASSLVQKDATRLAIRSLELYLGIQAGQLRFFNTEGQLLPTGEEAAALAQQQAEQERQPEQLAAKLRELDIDPDTL